MIQVYKQKPYHCAIIFYTPTAILLQLLSSKRMPDSTIPYFVLSKLTMTDIYPALLEQYLCWVM